MSTNDGFLLPVLAKASLASLLAAAPPNGAFEVTFHRGVPLVYDVWRGDGVEHSRVTLTPIDSTNFPLDTVWTTVGSKLVGTITQPWTRWTLAVEDSLLHGTRHFGEGYAKFTPTETLSSVVRRDTAILVASDTARAWTSPTCLVPWDLEGFHSNPLPAGSNWGHPQQNLTWGGFSLVCERGFGIYGTSAGTTNPNTRIFIRAGESRSLDVPISIWNPDTGMIAMDDPDSRWSWRLRRLGEGPDLSLARASRRILAPLSRGDRWTWRRIDRADFRLDISRSRVDTSWIRWTVISSLPDSGRARRWRLAREERGRRDTVTVAIDTLLPPPRRPSQGDSSLDVLSRWMSIGVISRWTSTGIGRDTSASGTGNWSLDQRTNLSPRSSVETGRLWTFRHEWREGVGLVRYEERRNTFGLDLTQQYNDTAVTFELTEWNGEPLAVDRRRPVGGPATMTLLDLDELVVRGGSVLEIRRANGVSLSVDPGQPPSTSLNGARGILFVSIRDRDGKLRHAKILAH